MSTNDDTKRSESSARGPRAVALVGPYGAGKSTLFRQLLAAADGAVPRAGEARGTGSEIAVAQCTFLGDPWTILDCPGSVEFGYEADCALEAADSAVIVCEPVAERAFGLARLFRTLERRGMPHFVFINKVDSLTTRVRDLLAALQGVSARPLVLRQVPIRGKDDHVTGYVDVISDRAYRYRDGGPSELVEIPAEIRPREAEVLAGLVEVLADHDDALLEKLIEDVQPTTTEIYQQLHKDQGEGAIVEVLLGAAEPGNGVRRLWKALRHDTPDWHQTALRRGIAAEGEPMAQIFKTVHAPHSGKLSFARIWRGAMKEGAVWDGARLAGLYAFPQGEATKIAEAGAGEVVAIARLEQAATGTCLSPSGNGVALGFAEPPAPLYALALSNLDRKDDVKLSGALQKLVEEDPSLVVEHSIDTGETILRGQGEIHLQAAVDKIGRNQKLHLGTQVPRVSFRETVRRAVRQHARIKRQTGGHGQFADVTIELEPRRRGEGFAFIDRIVGGAVPRQYIPAVAEAAEEALSQGAFGYPVIDVAVTLIDGTYHTVDSSDMAFKNATRAAIAEALPKAEPVLLEPVDHVTVSVPNEFTAGMQRLLIGRRAHILGYSERAGWPGWDDIDAEVPETELHDLITELRSRTMGMGTYVRHFDHLAEAPSRLTEKIARTRQA